jgi:hypothetical protein
MRASGQKRLLTQDPSPRSDIDSSNQPSAFPRKLLHFEERVTMLVVGVRLVTGGRHSRVFCDIIILCRMLYNDK